MSFLRPGVIKQHKPNQTKPDQFPPKFPQICWPFWWIIKKSQVIFMVAFVNYNRGPCWCYGSSKYDIFEQLIAKI